MKKPPTSPVVPDFEKGKTGEKCVADLTRVRIEKPGSSSAKALSDAGKILWDRNLAQSQKNSHNASHPRRKNVTWEDILAAKKSYEVQYGRSHGWKTYVALSLKMDPKTLEARRKEKK